jgi:N-acyl-D-aspartate/D-glutamate deacylase
LFKRLAASPALLQAVQSGLLRFDMRVDEAAVKAVAAAAPVTSAMAATTEEIIAVGQPLGAHGGLYVTHMRNESDAVVPALEETFRIADKVVILANGRIAAQGTPEEVRHSTDPLVHQFVSAAPEGPVRFHYPASTAAEDFGVAKERA